MAAEDVVFGAKSKLILMFVSVIDRRLHKSLHLDLKRERNVSERQSGVVGHDACDSKFLKLRGEHLKT